MLIDLGADLTRNSHDLSPLMIACQKGNKELIEHFVKNKIDLKISPEKVFVIDSLSIAAFINKNGDLFISDRILELSDKNENEIALFIGTEITSNLMEKFTSRIINFLIDYYIPLNKSKVISKTNKFVDKIDANNEFNKFFY